MEVQKDPKKKSKIELLEEKWEKATPVHYAKFHQAIAPAMKKEPVHEFYIKGPTGKYLVDALRWSWGDGLIYKAYGEINLTPAPTVAFVKFTL